jgi:hypothetical protein
MPFSINLEHPGGLWECGVFDIFGPFVRCALAGRVGAGRRLRGRGGRRVHLDPGLRDLLRHLGGGPPCRGHGGPVERGRPACRERVSGLQHACLGDGYRVVRGRRHAGGGVTGTRTGIGWIVSHSVSDPLGGGGMGVTTRHFQVVELIGIYGCFLCGSFCDGSGLVDLRCWWNSAALSGCHLVSIVDNNEATCYKLH